MFAKVNIFVFNKWHTFDPFIGIFIVIFIVTKHQLNKLIPVITYVISAINILPQQLLSRVLFFPLNVAVILSNGFHKGIAQSVITILQAVLSAYEFQHIIFSVCLQPPWMMTHYRFIAERCSMRTLMSCTNP